VSYLAREKKNTKRRVFTLIYRFGEIVMLQVHARKLGTVAVLCLQGQIVTGETQILRNAVISLSEVQSEVDAVILDLARVTTVDAGGLGVMLALREQLQAKGIRFELMNVNKWVKRVLELTRLDTVFRITPTVEYSPVVSEGRRASVAAFAPCA
jgi:anti-anti-sigma factor